MKGWMQQNLKTENKPLEAGMMEIQCKILSFLTTLSVLVPTTQYIRISVLYPTLIIAGFTMIFVHSSANNQILGTSTHMILWRHKCCNTNRMASCNWNRSTTCLGKCSSGRCFFRTCKYCEHSIFSLFLIPFKISTANS